MTISAASAARHLCALSGWTVTDSSAHKLVYCAHLHHMGRSYGGLLVAERFYATDRGPVVLSLVETTRHFGANPIKDKFGAAERIPKGDAELLEEIWQRFGKTPNHEDIANLTRHPKSAFARRYVRGRAVALSDREIFEEYEEIISPTDAKLVA